MDVFDTKFHYDGRAVLKSLLVDEFNVESISIPLVEAPNVRRNLLSCSGPGPPAYSQGKKNRSLEVESSQRWSLHVETWTLTVTVEIDTKICSDLRRGKSVDSCRKLEYDSAREARD